MLRLENILYYVLNIPCDVTSICVLKKFKNRCLDPDLKGILAGQNHGGITTIVFVHALPMP